MRLNPLLSGASQPKDAPAHLRLVALELDTDSFRLLPTPRFEDESEEPASHRYLRALELVSATLNRIDEHRIAISMFVDRN